MTGLRILLGAVIIVISLWVFAMPTSADQKPHVFPKKFPDRVMHNPLDPWFYK